MAEDERTEQEKRDEEGREEAKKATVRATQKSLGEDEPYVSEAVRNDPVARNTEPYKSLLAAEGEPIPDDLKDDDEDLPDEGEDL